MKAEEIIGRIIIGILILFLLGVAMGFILAEFNPFEWDMINRALVALVGIPLGALISTIPSEFFKPKY